jgi:hypothetical protein
VIRKIVFFIIFFISYFQFAYSQYYLSGKISILNGTQVAFNFNMLSKIENGITLNDWTQLAIAYTDTTAVGADGRKWELMVRTDDSYLPSDFGSITTFSPGFILMTTTYIGDGTVSVVSDQPLSTTDTYIARQTDNATIDVEGTVIITFKCANTGQLIGYESNYFTTDLIFTLKEQ